LRREGGSEKKLICFKGHLEVEWGRLEVDEERCKGGMKTLRQVPKKRRRKL